MKKSMVAAVALALLIVAAVMSSCTPESSDTAPSEVETSAPFVTTNDGEDTSEAQETSMEPIVDTDTGWGPLIPMTPVE